MYTVHTHVMNPTENNGGYLVRYLLVKIILLKFVKYQYNNKV